MPSRKRGLQQAWKAAAAAAAAAGSARFVDGAPACHIRLTADQGRREGTYPLLARQTRPKGVAQFEGKVRRAWLRKDHCLADSPRVLAGNPHSKRTKSGMEE